MPMSHVEFKKHPCHMSLYCLKPCRMSIGPISHVEFKKWPCCLVEFKGQGTSLWVWSDRKDGLERDACGCRISTFSSLYLVLAGRSRIVLVSLLPPPLNHVRYQFFGHNLQVFTVSCFIILIIKSVQITHIAMALLIFWIVALLFAQCFSRF